jgi:hypothetical protein
MPATWNAAEETEFIGLMNKLGLMFNRAIGRDLLALYRDELADIDADMVLRGLGACVHESRFWPSIAEIRDRAGANNPALMRERIESRNNAPAHLPGRVQKAIGDYQDRKGSR